MTKIMRYAHFVLPYCNTGQLIAYQVQYLRCLSPTLPTLDLNSLHWSPSPVNQEQILRQQEEEGEWEWNQRLRGQQFE